MELQPAWALWVRGVMDFDDSVLIMRVKFKCKSGHGKTYFPLMQETLQDSRQNYRENTSVEKHFRKSFTEALFMNQWIACLAVTKKREG